MALCAARTDAQPGDIYLDDVAHHALSCKFERDWLSEGRFEDAPNSGEPEWLLMDSLERGSELLGPV